MARPRPVCVGCKKEMLPEKIGAAVQLNNSEGPYQLWTGDMFGCATCGNQVVTNFSQRPMSERHERTFAVAIEGYAERIVAVVTG